jgi:hypothetical protein
MKGLTVWQPWASAIALGSKRIETRSWHTSKRGRIAIHAARRMLPTEMAEFMATPFWVGALGLTQDQQRHSRLQDILPFGKIIATVKLVACIPTEELFKHNERLFGVRKPKNGNDRMSWNEYVLGDYSPGRYGWIFEDVELLPKPFNMAGAQGLFTVNDRYILAAGGRKEA